MAKENLAIDTVVRNIIVEETFNPFGKRTVVRHAQKFDTHGSSTKTRP